MGHAFGTVKPKMVNPVLAVEQIQRSLSVGLRIARAVGALTPQSFPSMIVDENRKSRDSKADRALAMDMSSHELSHNAVESRQAGPFDMG